MKTSETIAAIAPAVVKAAAELGPVTKDATNPAFRNKYASLDAIMEQVRPVLARHGLAVLQGVAHPETVDGRVVGLSVETRLLHQSGEWLATVVTLPVEKPTAQGAGSAISYGRRYGLSAMLGLTAEDDDGNAASEARHTARTMTAAAVAVPVADAEAGRRLHEAVPTTPRRKPFSGDLREAMATPFPFKKNPDLHGRPLSEVSTDVLVSTADWCRKTDAAKFGDLIARIEAVVHYHLTLEQEQIDADRQDAIDRDVLPF